MLTKFCKYISNNSLFLFKPKVYKKFIKNLFNSVKSSQTITRLIKNHEHEIAKLEQQLNTLKLRIDYLDKNIDLSLLSFLEYEAFSSLKNVDLLILDTFYPLKYSGFRFIEYNSYLHTFENSLVLTNFNDIYNFKKDSDGLLKILDDHLLDYPEHTGRIKFFHNNLKVKARLASLVFVNNVILFLPFLEKNRITFVFTLYPGGGFYLNNDESDAKLKKIFSSPYFAKVIITQRVTYNYILENNLCSGSKIEYIYGGIVSNSIKLFDNKSYFGFNKESLDICFVAQKYTEFGADKGYDTFIESAKLLVKKYNNINFHVVGGFSVSDIDVVDLGERIKFYGVRTLEWFDRFYLDKDIIVSPNIPFVLHQGAFDGFPLICVVDAMNRNVAAFCCDELKQNQFYTDNVDMVFIKPSAIDIVKKVEYYLNNPDKLKFLALNGKKLTKDVFSDKRQILPRIKILQEYLNIGYMK